MSTYVRTIDKLDSTSEEVAFHFKARTIDKEEVHLYIWDDSPAVEIEWAIDNWYELSGVRRKQFGDIIELNAVADTEAYKLESKEGVLESTGGSNPLIPQDSDKSTPADFTVGETLEWLREESKYSQQIKKTKSIPEQSAKTREASLLPRIQDALEDLGIDELYHHQHKALNAARDGSNLVLASDTASGKSIPYQIHACETALKNNATSLYIAPYKALINDQAESFDRLINGMDLTTSLSAEVYTGDVPQWKKKRIRQSRPNILLMTPEQVHNSLLAWHDQIWDWFFSRLSTVIIDEVHEFRGTFGSHIGHVCRRLNRLATQYSSDPQYFCCSATIGNPKKHASNITDEPTDSFVTIQQDTSERGTRHWLLYNPPYKLESDTEPPGPDYPDNWGELRKEVLARDRYTCTNCGLRGGRYSPVTFHVDHILPAGRGGAHTKANLRTLCTECHDKRPGHSISTKRPTSAKTAQEVKQERERQSHRTVALQLFIELVSRGHQTVVFEKTRQNTETYAEAASSELTKYNQEQIAESIRPYHSHLPNDIRENIESGLQSGKIRGVWATSALEVGVDIGGLDAVILSGHPGTTMELFQRAGRAGRGNEDCLVLFVASGDPLDQYCISNPKSIFNESPGNATSNTENPEILDDHILSAADELPLTESEKGYSLSNYRSKMLSFEQQGQLTRTEAEKGLVWECEVNDPQESVDLRGISDWDFNLVTDSGGSELDTSLSLREAIRDCHPDAIYMLNKQKYKVSKFDSDSEEIHLTEYDGPEFTQALPEENIIIENIIEERQPESFKDVSVGVAEVKYTSEIREYLLKESHSDTNPEKRPIRKQLPAFELDTEAIYLTIPNTIRQRAEKMAKLDHPFLSGLHGVEHLLLSLFPLEVLCEKDDVSGLSLTSHPQTGTGTIFIYDNIPGGIGLARTAFEEIESLLERSHDLVTQCGCDHGCPSCIHSSGCQVGNRALHKGLTTLTIEWMNAAGKRIYL